MKKRFGKNSEHYKQQVAKTESNNKRKLVKHCKTNENDSQSASSLKRRLNNNYFSKK